MKISSAYKNKNIEKNIEKISEVLFAISLILLTQFDYRDYNLGKYQIVVSVFWACGLLKFKKDYRNLKDKGKDTNIYNTVKESAKELIVSIATIPLLYWIGNSVEVDTFLFSPLSIIFHYIILFIYFWAMRRDINEKGFVVIYTHALLPFIIIVLLQFGIPVLLAIFVVLGMADYFCNRYSK